MRRWIYKGMSDEALIALYAKGQADAFECLYLRNKKKVFSFLRRQCNNSAIAEELAHDTWLAIINQASHYKKQAKFTTWVFKIAHNRLVDYWRKHGSATRSLVEEIKEQHATSIDTTSEGLEIDNLLNKLEGLPDDQLAALLLKIEGFSHTEIAEITCTKKETVKSRLRYATNSLRASMEVQA